MILIHKSEQFNVKGTTLHPISLVSLGTCYDYLGDLWAAAEENVNKKTVLTAIYALCYADSCRQYVIQLMKLSWEQRGQ